VSASRSSIITPNINIGSSMSSGSGSGSGPIVPMKRGLIETLIYEQSKYNLERIRDNATSFMLDFKDNTQSDIVELRTGYTQLKGDIETYQPTMSTHPQIDIDIKINDFNRREISLSNRRREIVTKNTTILSAGMASAHFWLISFGLYWLGPTWSLYMGLCYMRGIQPLKKLVGAFWSIIWYPIVILYSIFSPPASFKIWGRITEGIDMDAAAHSKSISKFRVIFRICSMLFFGLFLWAVIDRNRM